MKRRYAFRTLAMLIFALAGCSTPPVPWGVPTTYEVRGLGQGPTTDTIRAHLRHALRGDSDPFGFVESSGASPYRFQLTRVADMDQLAEAQAIIRGVLAHYHVPVAPTRAHLTFQSIEGTARAVIVVQGKATPGSTVYLDTGRAQPMVVRSVSQNGHWQTPVPPNPKLRERGGWVFGLVTKHTTRMYFRVSVFNPGASQAISAAALPRDSVLHYPSLTAAPTR